MKGKVPVFVILGSGLILLSLCLGLYFGIRTYLGSQTCLQVVSRIEQLLPDRTVGEAGANGDAAMPVMSIGGEDYVALLEIPSFGMVLPVADLWDSGDLSVSPARFWGSAYDNTLIIGGADSARQFGFCDEIQHGAIVTVTDMTGGEFTYTVARIDRAKHAQIPWLTGGEWDLTLFCHDGYSMEYIAVRCVETFQ